MKSKPKPKIDWKKVWKTRPSNFVDSIGFYIATPFMIEIQRAVESQLQGKTKAMKK